MELVIKVPRYIEMGVRKVKKYYLTTNNYRNRHYQVSNNLKKKFKEQVEKYLRDVVFHGPIQIHLKLVKGTKRRLDLDSCVVVLKFFQDALVECGCIEDDDCETILRTTNEYGGYVKDDGHVLITVTEVSEK